MRDIAEQLVTSVRPVVTYMIAAAFIAGFFLGLVPQQVFADAAIMVISFWYGQRSGEKSKEEATAAAVAAVQQAAQGTAQGESNQ